MHYDRVFNKYNRNLILHKSTAIKKKIFKEFFFENLLWHYVRKISPWSRIKVVVVMPFAIDVLPRVFLSGASNSLN